MWQREEKGFGIQRADAEAREEGRQRQGVMREGGRMGQLEIMKNPRRSGVVVR